MGDTDMAKFEQTLNGDFYEWLNKIEEGILNGSISASLEDSSDFRSDDARCSVRVFERYSYAGGNRVSLSVTLFQNGNGPIYLSAITAGGSQAVFFKINTFGDENICFSKYVHIISPIELLVYNITICIITNYLILSNMKLP